MKIKIIYRVSDKGEVKDKLPIISNAYCLENFIVNFPVDQIVMIGDNISNETDLWLQKYNFSAYYRTELGNCESFWFGFNLALEFDSDTLIYFVENDYIHRQGSLEALFEGSALADYVSLYDHPDKYLDGINPLVHNGGERTKLLLTKSCHWKFTNSTTMTFAATVHTLSLDAIFFKNFTVGVAPGNFFLFNFFQKKSIPNDFRLFRMLGLLKHRKLVTPIPGFSSHGEEKYLTPFFEDNF
jgi:hypothetical protein